VEGVVVVAPDGPSTVLDEDGVLDVAKNSMDSFSVSLDTGGRFTDANESVHYHHCIDGYSCHGCVEQVTLQEKCPESVRPSNSSLSPWVHVFAKSSQSSSLRTQAALIAYIEQPVHKKARHIQNRRSKNKMLKQEQLLTEVIVPEAIQQNLLTTSDINNDIVVIDGGDDGNPPIRPLDGVIWRCLAVRGGKHLHVQDETDPSRGLTFTRIDGALPFIRMPRQQSLAIMRQTMMNDIVAALEECEKLKKTSLI
jgi:hypothetical protein